MSRLRSWFRRFAQLFSSPPAKRVAKKKPTRQNGAPKTSTKSAPKRAVLKDRVPDEDAPARIRDSKRINLDSNHHMRTPLGQREAELVERIASLIEVGKMELPHLPATSSALIGLSGRADVEVKQVVQLISSDPSLASELLRLANSVIYAAHEPAETLDEAVMRIGMRGLRSLIFTVSVRGSVLRLKGLEAFSEETWRQALSVATIARAIAPSFRMDPERAFLVGLLHDIGKIAILSMVSKECRGKNLPSPATVGRLFHVHHENAGGALATKWRLDAEILSVAGLHHDYSSNEKYGRSAALASLSHKLDLHLSFDDDGSYRELVHCGEFEFLEMPMDDREAVLDKARRVTEIALQEEHGSPRSAA